MGKAPDLATDTDGVFAISYKKFTENQRGSRAESLKSAADFEQAIIETGFGKFNYLLLLLAFPASCSSNFSAIAVSYVLPTASCDLHLDSYDRGLINSAIYAGMISSSFFWGYVSDKFGRQRCLVVGYFGDFLFGVGCSLAQDLWTLLAFRFLCGVMICGPFSTFVSYMSELIQADRRDSAVLLVGLFQSLGGTFQSIVAWAVVPMGLEWTMWGGRFVFNSWRLFLLVSTLPSLVAGVGSSFCFESPRFLLAKGRKDEALKVFRSIYSYNTGRPANTYSVKKLKVDASEGDVHRKMSFWEEATGLFRPPHLHKTLLGCMVQFGGLMTFNTMKLWSPQFFYFINQMSEGESLSTCDILGGNRTSGTTDCDKFVVDTSIYVNMVFLSALTAASFATCALTISRVGKRNVLVFLFLCQTVVISGLGWMRPPFITALSTVFVAFSNTSSIGLISFIVQIFPTRFRTMAVSLTMMSGRVGALLGNAVLLPLFISVSCHATFIGMGVITLVCAAILYVLAAISSVKEVKQEKVIES